jgi:hypothetical protein
MTEFQKWVEDCYNKSNLWPDKDPVKRMFMNPKTFANFRDWAGAGFDPYRMREMIVTFRHYGVFWGEEHRDPDCTCDWEKVDGFSRKLCEHQIFDKGVVIIGIEMLPDNAMVTETKAGMFKEFKLQIGEKNE